LNYARMKAKSYLVLSGQLLAIWVIAHRENLLKNFSYLTGTYCTTTFTNRKLQTFLHSDRLN